MTAPVSRVVVITPRLDGADGISEVSRQAVLAFTDALGPRAVEVWTLDGGAPPGIGCTIKPAGGWSSRLAAWGLAAAAGRVDQLLVFVLHVHLLPVTLAAAMRGAKLACFMHGIEVWRRLRPRERAALARATALVANSRWTAEGFRRANPDLAAAPIAVCPLGVSTAPQPLAPGLEGYALIVGRVAADERYKGHDTLIEVWPDVLRRTPEARLIVVGDGDDRRRLEALARARGLGDRVIFAGQVSDEEREGYYRSAAFFVMPSTREGFGLAYLEAMRAGKPCIASPGAAAELIEDGVTGLLVDPSSRPALTDAIVRLFGDPRRTREMGEAAAECVNARFTAARFAECLLTAVGVPTARATA